jgi:ATP adenylyltransferase
MERIWSPWRSQYISSFGEKDDTKNNINNHNTCFICEAINSINEDVERLIVARKKNSIILLNKYPYNSGHTLVAPLQHLSDFQELSGDILVSIMSDIQEVVTAMKTAFKPHGFNIGINVGQSAGAGLPGHLHFHIVPRWNGDSNFTATIADMKVISSSMEQTRLQLTKLFS